MPAWRFRYIIEGFVGLFQCFVTFVYGDIVYGTDKFLRSGQMAYCRKAVFIFGRSSQKQRFVLYFP